MKRLTAKFNISYPEFTLDAKLDVPVKGFTVIFGPSGCGKTTLLRCLSGLERSRQGVLKIGDEIWQDETQGLFLPVNQRPIGYVFQEARLFSHLNVEGNIRFGFRRCKSSSDHVFFSQIVDIMELDSLLERQIHKLSGGERQRVAIGRALLTRPRLLLMDEPLAALDAKRKAEILPYVQRLQNELGIPVFYVTHSLNEVLQLVDTMVLMGRGKIVSVGPVEEAFSKIDIRGHVDSSMVGGILDARVLKQDEAFNLTVLDFNGQTLYLPRHQVPRGHRLRIHIHAGDVTLSVSPIQHQTSFLNVLPARVMEIHSGEKDDYMATVKLDIGCPLIATITRKSLALLNLQIGQEVFAQIKALRMVHDLMHERVL